MKFIQRIGHGVQTFASDVAQGLFEIAHNGFAVVGLVLAFFTITMVAKPELRMQSETALIGWLQARQPVVLAAANVLESEPDAIERATASNPKDLPKQQAAVAYWLSKKYRVAPEPLSALVAEAYEVGAVAKIDPTLILAIMAIESSFNPFAQSTVGAQGLMQVMTNVHSEKYEGFGGKLAAFDPVTNLRVGVQVLQDCIARAGSVELGLRCYVGATTDATEAGYAAKVMAEQARLRAVANGRALPTLAATLPVVAPIKRPTPVSVPFSVPEAAKLEAEDKIAAFAS